MAYKKRKKPEENMEEWLTTYSDAITLLLCFFVVLLTISEPNQAKFEEVKKGFMSEFVTEMADTPFISLKEALFTVIEENEIQADVAVEETDKGLALEVSGAALYAPGSADLKPEAKIILGQIVEAVQNFEYDNYKLDIEGHTDDAPIKSEKFYNNWDLAAMRATRVLQFFEESGIDHEKMRAVSYADTEPKVPNADEMGNAIPENRELNRRVVIRIERE